MITKAAAEYQGFIKEFDRCARTCYECLNACLDEEDADKRKRCVKMLIECARMCETSAFFMAMDGKFIKRQCELCAEVCDVCAQECSVFDDQYCRKCYEECRSCADKCREMLKMT